jgi:hypothetical protein
MITGKTEKDISRICSDHVDTSTFSDRMKHNTRNRLQFLRLFGFCNGSSTVTDSEIEEWENLVSIDVTAANLDQFASNVLFEMQVRDD